MRYISFYGKINISCMRYNANIFCYWTQCILSKQKRYIFDTAHVQEDFKKDSVPVDCSYIVCVSRLTHLKTSIQSLSKLIYLELDCVFQRERERETWMREKYILNAYNFIIGKKCLHTTAARSTIPTPMGRILLCIKTMGKKRKSATEALIENDVLFQHST